MRFDRRTFLGAGLAAAAALTGWVATRPPSTEPVLVAARAITPGRPLSADMVAVRRIGADEGLVPGDDPATLTGWVVTAPLEEGEPLIPSQLLPPQRLDAPDVIAVELPSPAAAAGLLHAGDLVDLYLTSSVGPEGERRTERIARSVHVVDVLAEDGFGSSGDVAILLAVDQDLALAIAAALHAGHLDLVRVAR